MIQKFMQTSKLITSTITSTKIKIVMKRTWNRIIQITNINKRSTFFQIMIKHEKHIVDSRPKIPENSNEFLCSTVKSLKMKFLHPMRRSMRILLIKMRNLKGLKIQGWKSSRQHSQVVTRTYFLKTVPSIVSRNSLENTCNGVFLLKVDSDTCHFLQIFQHFEKHFFFVKNISTTTSEHS